MVEVKRPANNSSLVPIDQEFDPNLLQNQKNLQKAAIDYRASKGLPAFNQGGLQLAYDIVSDAYLRGISLKRRFPETRKEFGLVMTEGFNDRTNFVRSSLNILSELGSDKMSLAIDNETLNKAKDELSEHIERARFPETIRVLHEVEERRRIIPAISSHLLKNELSRMGFNPDEADSYIPNLQKQSIFLRGFICSSLLRESALSEDTSPIYLQDQDIDQLRELIGKNDYKNVLTIVADKLSIAVSSLGFDPDMVAKLIEDYGGQIASAITMWFNYLQNRELKVDDPDYWKRKYQALSTLPVESFLPDVQFVFSQDNLSEAVKQGKPHLWQDSTVVSDYVLPTLKSIDNAINLLTKTGFSSKDDLMTRLLRARYAWRDYKEYGEKLPDKTVQLIVEIAQLRSQQGEITDLSKKGELDQAKRDLERVTEVVNAYRRVDQSQEAIKAEVELVESIRRSNDPDSTFKLKTKIFLDKNDRFIKAVGQRFGRITTLLDLPSFSELFFQKRRGGFYSEESVIEDLVRVEQVSSYIQAYQEEGFPKDIFPQYATLANQIAQIVKDKRSEFIRGRISGVRIQSEMELVRIFMALNKGKLTWGDMKPFILEDLQYTKDRLTDFISLSRRKKGQAQSIKKVQEYLASLDDKGLKGEAEQVVNSAITDEDIDKHIKLLYISLLPPGEINKVYFKDLEELNIKFLRFHGTIQFQIPHQEDFIEEVENKKRSLNDEDRKAFFDEILQNLDNPFIPWGLGKGLFLSPFMSALNKRIQAIRSRMKRQGVEDEYQGLQAQVNHLQGLLNGAIAASKLIQAEKDLEMLSKNQAVTLSEFLELMKSSGFAIPKSEFDKLVSSA